MAKAEDLRYLADPFEALGEHLERMLAPRLDDLDSKLSRLIMLQTSMKSESTSDSYMLQPACQNERFTAAHPTWAGDEVTLQQPVLKKTWEAVKGCRISPKNGQPCGVERESAVISGEVSVAEEPLPADLGCTSQNGERFKFLSVWQERAEKFPQDGGAKRTLVKRMSLEDILHDIDASADQRLGCRPFDVPWYILRPSSTLRLAWDLVSMIMIGYDTITIPVILCFEPREMTFMWAMSWVCMLWWTADMPMSTITGYYSDGEEVLHQKPILVHYLKTWFFLDFIIVGSDWFGVFFGGASRGVALARMGKSLRSLRIVRSLRLLRMMKIKRILDDVQDRFTSEYLHIMIGISKNLTLIVCLNHVLACAFWGISITVKDSRSWSRSGDFVQRGVLYQYFTSLHWSLTQFTPASMEVVPQCTAERIFTVCVLLFAMVIFSSFVSSITAAMTSLRNLSGQTTHHLSLLRRYLRERQVDPGLTVRVVRYAEHRLGKSVYGIREADVKLLQGLSTPLQSELLWFSYQPIVVGHPLFRRFYASAPDAVMQLCQSALGKMSLSTQDVLFREGSVSNRMFFVLSGSLRYYSEDTRTAAPRVSQWSADPQVRRTTADSVGASSGMASNATLKRQKAAAHADDEWLVGKGSWCCEATLWTTWIHTGKMMAHSMVDLISLDAAAFARVVQLHGHVAYRVIVYGRRYVDMLNAKCGDACVISDLRLDEDRDEETIAVETFDQPPRSLGSPTKWLNEYTPERTSDDSVREFDV